MEGGSKENAHFTFYTYKKRPFFQDPLLSLSSLLHGRKCREMMVEEGCLLIFLNFGLGFARKLLALLHCIIEVSTLERFWQCGMDATYEECTPASSSIPQFQYCDDHDMRVKMN